MLTGKDYCDKDLSATLIKVGFMGFGYFYYEKDSSKLKATHQSLTVRTAKALGHTLAISLYEAQKWLREEKCIIVDVRYGAPYYNVVLHHRITYGHYVVKDKNNRIADFIEYEEALSEGIKEAVNILKENETMHE